MSTYYIKSQNKLHPTNSIRIFATNALKSVWIAVVMSAFIHGATAQTAKLKAPDSLLNAVRTSTGTNKVDALNRLAKQTILFSTAEAVPIVKEAIQRAEMIHYHKGEANAIENMALLEFRNSNFHKAINLMNDAALIYKKYNYHEAYINCLIIEASFYEFINDNGKIIDTYQQAIEASKEYGRLDLESKVETYFALYFLKIDDKSNASAYLAKAITNSKNSQSDAALGHTYFAIALYYGEDKQYQKAISNLRMALNRVSLSNEIPSKAILYSTMGRFFMESNRIDSAFVNYYKALKFGVILNDAGIIATTYTRMAHIFQQEQQLDSALKYQKFALNLRRRQGNLALTGSSLTNIGSVYAQKRDYPRALNYYNQGLTIAKETGYLKYIQFNYQCLYDLYLTRKNYEKAIHYNLLLSGINDSILSIETRRKFSGIQARFENEQKQKAIEFLTKENDIQNLKINQSRVTTYIMGALLILLIAIGVLLNLKAKLKTRHRQMESEQKLLRSQMNPRFIFNALIAIQSFIYNNAADEAAKYLASFARLIRLVLSNSRQEFVTLRREIDMIENYLALQKMRFENKFDYTFIIDPMLDPEFIKIPPMLAQPFLEHAIEHSIFGINKLGNIEVSIFGKDQNILIQVVDNGNNSQHTTSIDNSKSDTLRITKERIRYLNHRHTLKITFSISELKDEHNQFIGTTALLVIPEKRLELASPRL